MFRTEHRIERHTLQVMFPLRITLASLSGTQRVCSSRSECTFAVMLEFELMNLLYRVISYLRRYDLIQDGTLPKLN